MGRYRFAVMGVAVTALILTPAGVVLPQRAEAGPVAVAAMKEPSVRGTPIQVTPREPGAEDSARPIHATAPKWPQANVAELELSEVDPDAVGDSFVRVQAMGQALPLRVETIEPQQVARLGGVGLGVRIQRNDNAKAAGQVRLILDYSGFAQAHDASFADRLRLVRLPGCAVEAGQGKRDCVLAPERLEARNDLSRYQMIVETEAAAKDESPPVLMLVSAASGSFSGNFGATDLAPTGSWQTGLSSGSFAYSYPVPEPPSLVGDGPNLAFQYNSSSVDGLTAASNAQSGWTGLGWALTPGYIERRYKPCADDAVGPGKKADQRNWGHLCWESPDENDGQANTTDPTNSELFLSLEGKSSRIVKDRASGAWKTEDDLGWHLEHLTGAPSGQPYWRVTTQTGEVYRFGYHRDSMWQVPFAGDDPGEPCSDRYNSGGSKYPGMCHAPYRWNLDQIVDANSNVTTLYWKREAWKYRWYATEVCCTEPPTYRFTSIDYDRGGYLDYIEWGSNLRVTGSRPTSKMVFNLVSRCSDTTTRDDPLANPYPIDTGTGNLTCRSYLPPFSYWDVPDDLLKCDQYECPGTSPAFFLVRRLDSIVTYSYDPIAGVWGDVHKLQLRFKYIQSPVNGSNGCCTPTLWLDYIRPVGLAGTGEVRLPTVDFDAVEFNGRVDWGPNWWFTKPKAILPRIGTVHNGFGGRVEVTYGRAQACPDGGTESSGYSNWLNSVQWDRANQDCFQIYDFWFPFGGGPEVFHGIYHKYLVTKVVEKDVVGGSPDVVTQYEYLDRPAWAKPVDYLGTTITVPASGGTQTIETATWSQARGYGTVRTLKGSGTDPAGYTVATSSFFRGMYDDTYANGSAKGTTVTDFDGNVVEDRFWRTGHELQQRNWRMTNYATRDYAEVESERFEYERVVTGDGPGIHDPALVHRVRTRSRDVRADGSLRYTDARVANNSDGLPIRRNDYGQDGVADNSCTSISYTMVARPAVTEQRSGDSCTSGALIGKTENRYDGRGNLTEERIWNSATQVAVESTTYDDYGRELTSTDALGKVTTTGYSPAVNWPYNGVTVTNPMGHRVTTWTSLLHGGVTRQSDVDNGRVVEVDYDQLGRVKQVWQPDTPRSSGTPSATISYTITYDGGIGQPTVAAKTTTAQLQSAGRWVTSHSFDDGWGRTREAQTPSPNGGRIVAATTYDARGLELAVGEPVHNSATAGSGLLNAAPAALPSWTRLSHDGQERSVMSAQQSYGAEIRRSTTTYHGADGVTATPPAGGNTEHWSDSRGQVTKVVEWVYWGVPYETYYEYDLDGNVTKITDARGSVRTFTYDWAGRVLSSVDPDAGTTTFIYDTAGQLLSTVDGRGQRVSHVYDDLGRQTSTWAGHPGTGTKLAEWVYDTVAKGELTSATSFSGGNAYTEQTLEYDAQHRPVRTRLTLPASEGILAGSYEFTAGFDKAGRQVQASLPAVPAAGMPAETVTTTFNDVGLPDRLTSNYGGGFTYVNQTRYSDIGRPVERRYGGTGQLRRLLTWDTATNRLANISTWNGATKAQDDDYHYDAADNITRITDKALAEPQSECFNYDLRNRLVFAWTTTKPDCSEGWWHSPDWKGPDPYWRNFQYDSVGNILKQDTAGRPGDYLYPAPTAPRPNAVTKIVWPDREDTFGYDNAGNMTSRTVAGATTAFQWDAFGRLGSATTNGQTVSDVYGAGGERLIRREPGRTTVYIGQMELESVAGIVLARRYYAAGDGAVIAVRRGNGTLTWLLADQQSSSQLAVDAETSAVQRQRYLPFGARRGGRDDITATERGFLGKTEDDSTGLVHLGARFYDPVVGKFLSPDPILDTRLPEWSNAYAYAGNNPITRMDPSGLAGCTPGEDCDLKRKGRGSKRVKEQEKKIAKEKQKQDLRYLCWNLGKSWACRQLPKQDRVAPWKRPKPKPLCDARCRKESSCVGHNGCQPAGPPKLKPKKACDAKCSKESGCAGHNGCGPAGPPKAKPKEKSLWDKGLDGVADLLKSAPVKAVATFWNKYGGYIALGGAVACAVVTAGACAAVAAGIAAVSVTSRWSNYHQSPKKSGALYNAWVGTAVDVGAALVKAPRQPGRSLGDTNFDHYIVQNSKYVGLSLGGQALPGGVYFNALFG